MMTIIWMILKVTLMAKMRMKGRVVKVMILPMKSDGKAGTSKENDCDRFENIKKNTHGKSTHASFFFIYFSILFLTAFIYHTIIHYNLFNLSLSDQH